LFLYGDYHTHTTYSHGKGSVKQNAEKAVSIGLKELAITDHGFLHRAYNIREKEWIPFLEDILGVKRATPQINLLVGIESNLIGGDGTIDVTEQQLSQLDVLVCGYHKFTYSSSIKEYWNFSLPVFMCGLVHKSSAKRRVINTDAFVKAIEKYPIDIISHPLHAIDFDIREVARAAAHYGTFLELNGKRINMKKQDVEIVLQEGADFVINSDAHSVKKIGDISLPFAFASECQIPTERIANWGKKPNFRKKK
jgi:putative hydrolase